MRRSRWDNAESGGVVVCNHRCVIASVDCDAGDGEEKQYVGQLFLDVFPSLSCRIE